MLQNVNSPVHTRSPMHAQLAFPLQAAGTGSQRGQPCGPNATSCTHTVPSGHSAQSGTTSHSAAGTHLPVQHAGVVSARNPSGHGGGSASQATLLASQLSRSVRHTPNRHSTASTPYSEHFACLHSIGHAGVMSSSGTPSHEQQSLWSLQSAGPAHSPGSPPPVVSGPLVCGPVVVVPTPEVAVSEPPPVVSDPPVAGPLLAAPDVSDPPPPVVSPALVAPPVADSVAAAVASPELPPPLAVVDASVADVSPLPGGHAVNASPKHTPSK